MLDSFGMNIHKCTELTVKKQFHKHLFSKSSSSLCELRRKGNGNCYLSGHGSNTCVTEQRERAKNGIKDNNFVEWVEG